eukprot:162368-Chlamydomonas_euryale.AAC.1
MGPPTHACVLFFWPGTGPFILPWGQEPSPPPSLGDSAPIGASNFHFHPRARQSMNRATSSNFGTTSVSSCSRARVLEASNTQT